MVRKILIYFFVLCSSTFAENEIDIEKRRERQEDFNNLINSQEINIPKTTSETIQENLILDVSSITLEGNTIFEDFQIDSFLNEYLGKEKNIYLIIKEIENKYIEKGHITTRVGLNTEKSDFSNGKVSLFVLEGKIGKVLYDEKENKFKTFITFPRRKEDILNIRDLDQGLDNLADNSKMDIKASNKDGYSDILIKRDNKPISVSINYNNLGQVETSRHRLKYSLGLHNLVGLNESIDLSYQMKLQRQRKDRNSENFSFNVSLPFKYWNFNYTYDSSEYLRTIHTMGKTYRTTGRTENQSFGERKVIFRNENHKIDLGARITLKDSKNYLDV